MNIKEISDKIVDAILTQSDKRFEKNLREEMQHTHEENNMVTLVTEMLIESRNFTVDYVNAMLNELLNAQKQD